MRRHAIIVLGLAAIIMPQPALARDVRFWRDASNVGRDTLVVAALGLPAIKGDWQGDLQAGGSMGVSLLATAGLKKAFPEWRPDHSDRKSFPSGHASVSFAAAASLQNRYGWQVGLPAQLVAAFVGFSRVEARKHHWYDVAIGAGVGEASGFLLTSRRDSKVRVLPWGDMHGAGLAMAARF